MSLGSLAEVTVVLPLSYPNGTKICFFLGFEFGSKLIRTVQYLYMFMNTGCSLF